MRKILMCISICISLNPPFTNAQNNSPYIQKVYDFRPAPGQFVNEMPLYEIGDTKKDMNLKAEECIKEKNKILISLGGYGGYLIFGFDHMIQNKKEKKDFKIWGNAFYAHALPESENQEGGSCEPGIVMVSHDANANGIPDDEWYELAGSEYYKKETKTHYQITYFKPDENKISHPNPASSLADTSYLQWKNNQNEKGYMARNVFHSQSYYPLWIDDDSLIFDGTKLANNAVDISNKGNYYVLYAYSYGYVDNHPNADDRSSFDISWAVDSLGNSVDLPGIHFVKVYTAIHQSCGWLGETSTEIMGAEDLHLTHKDEVKMETNNNNNNNNIKIYPNPCRSLLHIISPTSLQAYLFTHQGRMLARIPLQKGENTWDLSNYPAGIYILKTNNGIQKIKKIN